MNRARLRLDWAAWPAYTRLAAELSPACETRARGNGRGHGAAGHDSPSRVLGGPPCAEHPAGRVACVERARYCARATGRACCRGADVARAHGDPESSSDPMNDFVLAVTCRYDSNFPAPAQGRLTKLIRANCRASTAYMACMAETRQVRLGKQRSGPRTTLRTCFLQAGRKILLAQRVNSDGRWRSSSMCIIGVSVTQGPQLGGFRVFRRLA
jgi:hypothetical protein